MTTKEYIEKFLKIRTKDGKIVPLILNKPQMKLYNAIKSQAEKGKPIRIICLKARQMGFSTVTEGVLFKTSATKKNVNVGIVAHEMSATNNLFEMFKRYYNNLPDALKPEMLKSNAKELIFNNKEGTGLDSRIQLFSAEARENLGRSNTFTCLHISEYAFWGDQRNTLTALLQCVPDSKDSIIIIESTANGYDEFQERYQRAVEGKSEYIPVFCGWWEMEEYTKEPPEDFELTAEENALKSLYNLTDGQIYWRRMKIETEFNGDINAFKQEYPACPEEAFISTGECWFNKSLIIERLGELRNTEPIKVGRFEYDKKIYSRESAVISNIKWIDDENGEIVIHKLPNKNQHFAIGGDTSGEGSDFFTAKVIENLSQECYATYRKQRIDDDLYADQMYCLGKYFNDAIIGLEVNFSIAPTNELERLGYQNLYMQERMDDISKRMVKKYGFRTDKTSRRNILANLVAMFRENPTIENDKETLREMLTFVKNESGKVEAMVGKHDDLVMASAIAHYVSISQGDFTTIKEEVEERDILKDFFGTEKREEGEYIEW